MVAEPEARASVVRADVEGTITVPVPGRVASRVGLSMSILRRPGLACPKFEHCP